MLQSQQEARSHCNVFRPWGAKQIDRMFKKITFTEKPMVDKKQKILLGELEPLLLKNFEFEDPQIKLKLGFFFALSASEKSKKRNTIRGI